jgi:hypothetical protein
LLLPYGNTSLNVSVITGLGEGSRQNGTIVSSPTYRPEIPTTSTIETGKVTYISTIQGQPAIDFLALFLAKDDVKSKRNNIFGIRDKYLDSLPEVLLRPLTYGRTGSFVDSDTP